MRDLFSLALVSSHFHTFASEFLYHDVHIRPPNDHEPHTHRTADLRNSLPGVLDTLTTSDYNYASHIRHFAIGNACGDLCSGSVGSNTPHKLDSFSCRMINTLMTMSMRKTKGLEIFHWDMNIEMSPVLFKALHDIPTLVNLRVRLHPGPSIYRRPPKKQNSAAAIQQPPSTGPVTLSATTYFPPPGNSHQFPNVAVPQTQPPAQLITNFMPPAVLDVSSYTEAAQMNQALHLVTQPQHSIQPHHGDYTMHELFPSLPINVNPGHFNSPASNPNGASVPPRAGSATFSGLKKLQRLSVLDIDDLSIVHELRACIRDCARTLTELELGFSNALRFKADEGLHTHGSSPVAQAGFMAINNANNNHVTAPNAWAGGENYYPDIVDWTEPEENVPNFTSGYDAGLGAGGPAAAGGAGPSTMPPGSTFSTATNAAQHNKAWRTELARREQDLALAYILGIDPRTLLPEKGATATGEATQTGKQAEAKGKGKAVEGEAKADPEKKQEASFDVQTLTDTFLEAIRSTTVDIDGTPGEEALARFTKVAEQYLAARSATAAPEPSAPAPFVSEPFGSASGSCSGPSSALEPAPVSSPTDEDVSIFKDKTSASSQKKARREADASRDMLPEDIDIEAPEGQLDLHPNDAPGDRDADEEQVETETQSKVTSKMVAHKSQDSPELPDKSKEKTPAIVSSDLVTDYALKTRGIQLKKLACHLIPVKASVLAKVIDISCLVRLTLLEVGPQATIWNWIAKENREKSLPLREVYSDDVSRAFLKCMSELNKLKRLYLLKDKSLGGQSGGAQSSAPITPPGLEDIHRFILQKHAKTLEVLSLHNNGSQDWDLDETTIRFLAKRAHCLQELAASMNMATVHMLLRCVSGFRALRAFHLLHLRNDDTCVWVMQEIRRFLVDTLSHYPHLPLTYLATEGAHAVDRIVRVDVQAKKSKQQPAESPSGGSKTQAEKTESQKTANKSGDGADDDNDDDIDNGMFYLTELTLESEFMCNVSGVSIFSHEIMTGML